MVDRALSPSSPPPSRRLGAPRRDRPAGLWPPERVAPSYDEPDLPAGGPDSVRVVNARLPQPVRRSQVRKEIVYRAATAGDGPGCMLLDGRYTTTHIWQLDSRQDGDELRVCFRQVRLPRELLLMAPHRPPALPAGGAADGQRRGLFWLVAEEVEVAANLAADAGASHARVDRAARAEPLWSHQVRRSAGASSVQLSLPAAAPVRLQDEDAPPVGRAAGRTAERIVGYVAVAAAPRDEQAYLRSLVVDASFRRRGIASRLLAEAKRWAVRQGAGRLMADVQARNYPALRLLQRAGFTFCGYNDCCYADGEVAVFFSTRLR